MKFLVLFAVLLLPCAAVNPDAEKGKTLGNPAAPIMMEIYSDYMCPACKHLHEAVLPAIAIDYVKTGKAFLVFREFPLDVPQHKFSRQAAALAVAAGRVGRYEIMSDALFASQPAWGVTGKVWDSIKVAFSPEEQQKVQALANDPAVLAEVQADVDRGHKANITQTPTIVITHRGRQQPWTKFNDYPLFRNYLDGLVKK